MPGACKLFSGRSTDFNNHHMKGEKNDVKSH